MNVAEKIGDLPSNVRKVVENANVFFSEKYASVTAAENSCFLYIYDNYYVMPVSIHKINRLFCVATFLSEPVAFSDKEALPYLQSYLDKTIDFLKKQRHVDWLSVTPASSLFKTYPRHSQRIKFGNYLLDLSMSQEELFGNISSKHRNMIRRGEKSELDIRFGGMELLDDYLTIDRFMWKRNGQEVDHSDYYRKRVSLLGENLLVAIAYKNEIPQCGLIGYYNQAMFYYMFAASTDKPEPGSTHYLQWCTISRMKECGVHIYNFVGCRINEDPNSKFHNIQRFKKGFGGELFECYLFRATLNKFKYQFFRLLLWLKTGKKPVDVIDQEIAKWSEIN